MSHTLLSRTALLALSIAGTMILQSGCVTTPATPEQAVAERAQKRWNALLAGDTRKAYSYLTPASRAVTSHERWLGGLQRLTVWKAAKVHAVKCPDTQRCVATINIDHQPLVMAASLGTISSAIDETWLIDNGEWWLLDAR